MSSIVTPPVAEIVPTLMQRLNDTNQLILKAPTGAGKSTYLPLALLESGELDGKIILLEPRRLAAKNIALYLAKQLKQKPGQSVGYRVRGESKVSNDTLLEVVTEAILTRMIQDDPELDGVSMVILDEFHERSIHADTALAFCLEVQQALRDDLKLLIMSATLEFDSFEALLPDAAFLESKGKSYPVEVSYHPVSRDGYWLNHLVSTVVHQASSADPSVILVFLPSVGSIERAYEELRDKVSIPLYKLHGRLKFDAQQQAIAWNEQQPSKIVLTTNVAETSLTIEGVKLVIDSGLEREASFNLNTGITKLEEKWVSQSSAIQRSGRAGRLGPGRCVRLYSQSQFEQMAISSVPEILRSDLSSLAMEMVVWGCQSPQDLTWLTPPAQANWQHAQSLLQSLHLLDQQFKATELLQKAYHFGASPRIASMLLQTQALSKQPALLSAAIVLSALIEEPITHNVDISHWLSLYQAKRHPRQTAIARRVNQLADKLNFTLNHDIAADDLALAMSFAFPDRVAKQRGSNNASSQWSGYQLANGHGAQLRSDEPLAREPYLVCAELISATHSASTITAAIALDIEQLQQLRPSEFIQQSVAQWDEAKGRLLAETRRCWGKLVVSRTPNPNPDQQDIEKGLINFVTKKGLEVFAPTESELTLIERVRCAKQWLPELDWPDFAPARLLEQTDKWLQPYLHGVSSAKQLRNLSLEQMLEAYLGWDKLQQLNQLLPTHLNTAAGSRKRLSYQFGQSPFLSVKLQEMFGESASPTIANGQVRVTLELLSPAQRPLQVTQDLAAFWQGAYNEVKKEMKGRYPKHPWPDEPQNHIATSKTKRQLNR